MDRGALFMMIYLVFACLSLVHADDGNDRKLLQAAGPTGSTAATLFQDVFAFWLKHGPDSQFGGFHGTLDRQGNPIQPTSKTLVQQARHLWTFSTLVMAQQKQSSASIKGYDTAAVRAVADTAYNFMKKFMATTTTDQGTAFVYEVGREGANTRQGINVINGAINLYANAFAIYGVSAYARATGSSEARQLALDTFTTLDKLYHSPYGGFDESNTGFTLDSIPLASTSSSNGSNSTSNTSAAKGAPKLSQSFNTLLHMAEALTELSIATGGSTPTVTARLLEHVQLLTGPLVIRPKNASGLTPSAYIAPNYDPRTWTPVGSNSVTYGHNIEAAWLLADAVDELQARGAIDGGKASSMKSVLQEVGAAAIAAGYDNNNGGMYDGSNIGASFPTSPNKVWWSQAEAMLGLDWLQRRTGQTSYKDKLLQTLRFVQDNLWDKQYGEWYWQVGPAGGAPLPFTSGSTSFAGTVKGTAWKASYHTGRAVLKLLQAGY